MIAAFRGVLLCLHCSVFNSVGYIGDAFDRLFGILVFGSLIEWFGCIWYLVADWCWLVLCLVDALVCGLWLINLF